jgi:hypothetical protein
MKVKKHSITQTRYTQLPVLERSLTPYDSAQLCDNDQSYGKLQKENQARLLPHFNSLSQINIGE